MAYADTGLLDVLVIDDDAEMRDLLTRLMLSEGHQAIAVATAEEGLEQLPYRVFDVALLDHQLPGMEGLVFGEYLRRNNHEMAIALVTGAANDHIARLAQEHDIQLIEKPFDPDLLLDFVDDHLRGVVSQHEHEVARGEPAWAPRVAAWVDELSAYYDMPSAPQRLEERLAFKIRDALNALRHDGRAAERHRVAAFAGLLAARVLGVSLPRERDGQTLYEVYDGLMTRHSRRREFTAPADPEGDE